MDPKLWGPHAWYFLHAITFYYPTNPTEDDKEHYRTFFNHLQWVIPCHQCQNHFKHNLTVVPLTDDALSSRNSLVRWLIQFHNEVNRITNKKTQNPKEMMKYYTNQFYSSDVSTDKGIYKKICVPMVFIVIFIGYFIYVNSKRQ